MVAELHIYVLKLYCAEYTINRVMNEVNEMRKKLQALV